MSYVINQKKVIKAAVQEYLLKHQNEGSDERAGRGAAVRGVMVRLGLYDEFCFALDQAMFPSPTATDADKAKFGERGK